MCAENIELGELGPGFPLFFEFIYYVTILLFILTIVYFLPCCVVMYKAYTKLAEGGLKAMDNVIAIFSFGVFVSHTDEQNIKFYPFEDRKQYLDIITILIMASVAISIVYLIWMRQKLLRKSLLMDLDAFTPSDFCLMGLNMHFEDCSPNAIENFLKEHLKDAYGVDEIEYVNPAYDIDEFYKHSEKINQLQKCMLLVEQYCEDNAFTLDKYRDMIS
mmetsp:Transcript_17892/g.30407  ORF Transcript_17892/g.30407 Transcript_17892/m.30407 type:complete len:217 (+) Transcript_17892:554-1204(+)